MQGGILFVEDIRARLGATSTWVMYGCGSKEVSNIDPGGKKEG